MYLNFTSLILKYYKCLQNDHHKDFPLFNIEFTENCRCFNYLNMYNNNKKDVR